jgi:hypothetical protein
MDRKMLMVGCAAISWRRWTGFGNGPTGSGGVALFVYRGQTTGANIRVLDASLVGLQPITVRYSSFIRGVSHVEDLVQDRLPHRHATTVRV